MKEVAVNRFLGAALVGVLLFGVSSCGDDPDGTTGRIFAPEDLEEALLTVENLGTNDLGDDWTVEMVGTFSSRDEGPPIFDETAWCPNALTQSDGLDELTTLASPDGADVEISRARDHRREFHGISQQLWSNDRAERFVEVIDRTFEFCDGETWNPGGEEADTVTLQKLDLSDRGDDDAEALMVAVTPGPDGSFRWNSRTVVIRVGTIVMVLRELDVQLEGSKSFFTEADWQRLLDTAMTKIQSLSGR